MTTLATVKRWTEEDCLQWAQNPTVNPKTGRKIDPNATKGVYQIIQQVCGDKYDIRPAGTSIPRVSPTGTQNKDAEATELLDRLDAYHIISKKIEQKLKKYLLKVSDPIKDRIRTMLRKKIYRIPTNILNYISEVEYSVEMLMNRYLLYGTDRIGDEELLDLEKRVTLVRYMKDIENIELTPEQERKSNELIEFFNGVKEAFESIGLIPIEDSPPLTESRLRTTPTSISSKSTDRSVSNIQRHSKMSNISQVARSNLTELPAKTRIQILRELKGVCSIMKDPITYERFDRMNKKSLQLIIKIGPGEQNKSCYYVRNIYQTWKNAEKDNKPFVDPVRRTRITEDEKKEIMNKIRYISKKARDPREQKEGMPRPKLDILFQPDGEYYRIDIVHKFGPRVELIHSVGYIPANIEPEDVDGALDLTSAVLLTNIRTLFDQGRLMASNVPPFRCCRIHLNKSKEYWRDPNGPKGISKNRLILMSQEVQQYM